MLCPNCGLPYATPEQAEEIEGPYGIAMARDEICWYGPGSAYSAQECRNPPRRARSRAALRSGVIERIEARHEEARRLTAQLRVSLLKEAFESRSTRKSRGKCRACGQRLLTGEPVVEYVDDDGTVVDVFHEKCAG